MQHPDAQRSFGENLRRVRQERGLTQERLALESGLHRTYVGACERGEINLSIGSATQLARTLGVTLAELVDGIE